MSLWDKAVGFEEAKPKPNPPGEVVFSLERDKSDPDPEVKPLTRTKRNRREAPADPPPAKGSQFRPRLWMNEEDEEEGGAGPSGTSLPDTTTMFPPPTRTDPPGYLDDAGARVGRRPRLLSVESDVESVGSVESVGPMTEADISTRQDKFIDFLSLSCGKTAIPVHVCFTKLPPRSCRTYEQYRPYLQTPARNALFWTDDVIRRISSRKLTLNDVIEMEDGRPVRASAVEVTGLRFRKVMNDNAIRGVTTKNNIISFQKEMANSISFLIGDIYQEVAGRSRRGGRVGCPSEHQDWTF
jgi:hypothetical protein